MSIVKSQYGPPEDDFPTNVPVTDGTKNYCNLTCGLSAGKTRDQLQVIPFNKRRTVLPLTLNLPQYGDAKETSIALYIGFCGFCNTMI